LLNIPLVVFWIRSFVQPGRETEVGELEMPIPVNKDVVGLDVTMSMNDENRGCQRARWLNRPVDIAKVVDSFNGKDTFGHIKPCNVF
jgi:hypothetical protein